ncbi:hypothetical protein [Nocardia sp. NPDC050406]|uniref:hypothetical protein n=1 Tax=Nocardia sp. NPDC050406 TaxID=3364318 RepID=UPI0037BB0A18
MDRALGVARRPAARPGRILIGAAIFGSPTVELALGCAGGVGSRPAAIIHGTRAMSVIASPTRGGAVIGRTPRSTRRTSGPRGHTAERLVVGAPATLTARIAGGAAVLARDRPVRFLRRSTGAGLGISAAVAAAGAGRIPGAAAGLAGVARRLGGCGALVFAEGFACGEAAAGWF